LEVVFGFRLRDYENYDFDTELNPEKDNNIASALSGKVLILNQSYEPISICSPKKAFVLIFLSKAELIAEKSGRRIHTISSQFPFPSIIKLTTYIKVPFKSVDLSRKNIIRRDGNRCQYCGKKSIEMTIDHILPKSRGGNDSWENLTTACVKCNNIKGNRTPEEAGMKLLSKPRKPNHLMFLKQHIGSIEDSWRPFLFMD